MIGIGIGIDHPVLDGSGGTPPGQIPILLIVAGQSNAGKQGTAGQTPPAKYSALSLKIWNNAGAFVDYVPGNNPSDPPYANAWSTEAEFTHLYRQAGGTRPVYMVKRALGGTSIGPDNGNDWSPSTSELFAELQTRVVAARAEIQTLEGQLPEEITFWNQGERDIQNNGRTADYPADLTAFMAGYRAQISTGLFVLERTRPFPGFYDNGFVIRQAQLNEVAADPAAFAVDCDFPVTDDFSVLHPGPDWCEGIGARAYAVWTGTYTGTFGDILDAVPGAPVFTDLSDQTPGAVVTSEVVTPTGFERDCAVSVTGGAYRILNPDDVEAVAWTSAPGRLSKWQKIQLRQSASASNSTATDVVLDLGGATSTWTVTTEAAGPDTTPDPFTFIDQTDVALSAVVVSAPITVAGIDAATPISITGGTYRINGGSFTSAAGTVSNGDDVEVQVTASASFSTPVSATVTIGGVSDTFDVTTQMAPSDTTPDPFAFTDAVDAPVSTVVASDVITPVGYTAAAAISVTGGEYRIDGGSWTAAAGSISPGSTVQVRGTSSGANSTTVDVALTIGGVSDTFSITTESGAPTGVASLFAQGEEGAWYDPSDLSTLFQDLAGTVPVTADGDPVGVMQDKSGRGHHLVAVGTANRPTYRTAGGVHWLEFDGSDDEMFVATRFGLAGSPDLTVTVPMRAISIPSNFRWIFAIGDQTAGNTLNGVFGGGTALHRWAFGNGRADFSSATAGQDFMGSWVFPQGGIYFDAEFFLDGVSIAATGFGNGANSPSNTAAQFRVGRRGGSNAANMRLYGMVVLDTNDSTRRGTAETWAAGQF